MLFDLSVFWRISPVPWWCAKVVWVDMNWWIGEGFAVWSRIGRLMNCRICRVLTLNWEVGQRLVKDSNRGRYVGPKLTLDWQIGLGLAEWWKGLALDWHLVVVVVVHPTVLVPSAKPETSVRIEVDWLGLARIGEDWSRIVNELADWWRWEEEVYLLVD